MRSFTVVAALAAFASAALYPNLSNLNHTCALQDPILSCSKRATPESSDVCCTETYGGLVLLTQFFSTYTGRESSGQLLPKDTWTLHGLWPDFCNGSYTQYCDLNRQYDPIPSPNTTNGLRNGTVVPPWTGAKIGSFVEAFGRYDLLDYMNTYWVAQNQDSDGFWAHEFSKHATCFSTFDLPCYGPRYREHEEVVEFFETAIKYYEDFPTYDFLADHDIVPSNKTRYTLSDLESAVESEIGESSIYFGCSGPRYNETTAGRNTTDNGRTVLSEAWYYMHVRGRPADHDYVLVPKTGSSNCVKAKGALLYPEQSPNSTRSVGEKSHKGYGDY